MAVTASIIDLYVKLGGQNYKLASMTDEAKQKIMQAVSDISALQSEIKAVNKGQITIAEVDPSVAENKDQFAAGVFYWAPTNSEDKFVEIDSTTGKPKEEQTTAGDNTEIVKYKIYIKGSDGTMNFVRDFNTLPDFTQYATLSGDNTFAKVPQVSASQDLSSAGDNELAKVGAAKTAIAAAKSEAINAAAEAVEAKGYLSVSYSATIPDELEEGKMVAVPAAALS